MFIETHPAIVECGFMTEEQLQILATLLKKSMIGNIDTSIKFLKLLVEWLCDDMNMNQSQTNPCVFHKLDDKHDFILIESATVNGCAIM